MTTALPVTTPRQRSPDRMAERREDAIGMAVDAAKYIGTDMVSTVPVEVSAKLRISDSAHVTFI